jgi:phosphoribosylglycinamide formyltransferase-1
MNRIVFLLSGGGANLKFIYFSIKFLNFNAQIVGVIADRQVQIEDFLKKEAIPLKVIKYNKGHSIELTSELRLLRPDLIITNFHKIIDIDTLNEFENKFINLHYSLLPSFSGLIGMKTLEVAMSQNVRFIGGTCHEVNEKVDEGKIIFQGCFSVDEWSSETFNSKVDTVFKLSCLLLLSGISDKLNLSKGNIAQAEINNYKILFSPALPLSSVDFCFKIFKLIK